MSDQTTVQTVATNYSECDKKECISSLLSLTVLPFALYRFLHLIVSINSYFAILDVR